MDALDPLCAVSSTTCLLRRTLGGPAPAASPSKADEALLRAISETLKGSKESIEQSKLVMKEYGDIQMVYQDDGRKAMAAANYKSDKPGRRPAGERKRYHFSMKYPASKPLPVVDRSVLDTISDPDEYFAKEMELDEAEVEIKRLNGEVQPKITLNFEPVIERKRRNPSRPRKSYIFSSDAHAASATMIPISQSEYVTESQTSQDDAHASVSEKNEHAAPSRSDKCAISDSLVEKDPLNEKDKDDEITNIMASFQNFEGPNRLDHLRKTIGIGKIQMETIYRRDSIPGDIPIGSTAGINQQEVCTLEGPLSGSHQARVSELEKHIFRDAVMDKHKNLSKDEFEFHTLERPLPESHHARVSELAARIFRDAATDKHTDLLKDDEFEGSPDFVMGEQALACDSSGTDLMTDETFSARGKNMEAPSPSAKSAEHALDPEPNMPDCGTIGDNPCSRHDISTEEDNVPMDYSSTDKSNNEAAISSHHLEDASVEMLANTPGRNVVPDDIARTSRSSETNIQHQEVVEEDGVVQDKSVDSLEVPLEDTGLQNQSQAPDVNIKKLRADLGSVLSPTKEKTQKTAQRGKTKQQPKRGKKVADESSLEIPQADFDSENQSHTHDVSTEKVIADPISVLPPTKEKTRKAAQRGKTKHQPKRGKKVPDESCHSLEIPQTDLDSENQLHTHDVNTERQTVATRNALLPERPKGSKEAHRRNRAQELNKRKSLADAGLEWRPSGVRRSTRIRYRPLEQWRGERFIYGRIHDTMVTVIGVKSYSPGDDGKKALKVKSFVPEEYSDIVTQGAKY